MKNWRFIIIGLLCITSAFYMKDGRFADLFFIAGLENIAIGLPSWKRITDWWDKLDNPDRLPKKEKDIDNPDRLPKKEKDIENPFSDDVNL